jgi:hypothetical protein
MISAPHIQIVVAEILELIGSGYARIEVAKPLNHLNYAYFGFMYTVANLEKE